MMTPEDEERIRQIIREELQSLRLVVQKSSLEPESDHHLDHYEPDNRLDERYLREQ